MEKKIIGVMGPANASNNDLKNAFELGRRIAEEGWITLTGGREEGVMDTALKGAKSANGITIGILPSSDKTGMSEAVDIPIITGLGSARNNINILSSDIIIACGMGLGTASEIALAIKARKKVILLSDHQESKEFFQRLGKDYFIVAKNMEEVIMHVKLTLNKTR